MFSESRGEHQKLINDGAHTLSSPEKICLARGTDDVPRGGVEKRKGIMEFRDTFLFYLEQLNIALAVDFIVEQLKPVFWDHPFIQSLAGVGDDTRTLVE